ncbi:MAG: metal ABC transporter permease [Cytophagales bacterium]|nr:metal ABC transporter permease [Cytophagales bacterium]
MEKLIAFFADPTIGYVILGATLLTSSTAIVGSFTFLKKKALVGDAIAHALLPGVCLAFILSGTKNPVYLVIGAFIAGWLALLLADFIIAKTKIKEDTAIALMLSVFFGLGILLLTAIQNSGKAEQAGLINNFLFGKVASIVEGDLITFSVISVLLIVAVMLFFKEFMLVAFDKNFAKTIGLPVKWLDFLLTSLTVLSVVVGIQLVGVVLMAAMLITPPVAARFWTDNLKKMVVLSAVLGVIAGFTGAFISYTAPAMPTGPWIVMVISSIALFSFLFAPQKGVLFKTLQQHKYQKKILTENILKLFYQLGEQDGIFFEGRTVDVLLKRRSMPSRSLKQGLKSLVRQGYIQQEGDLWFFTEAGKNKGQTVLRLHRLWEVYLTAYLKIKSDHVHDDAESIEHIITPEIEAELKTMLNYPLVDPHQSTIPYQ